MRALVALSLLSAVLGCGRAVNDVRPPANRAHPIVYGETCDEDEGASAVALLFEGNVDFGFGFVAQHTVLCSGVLVAPDAVLTARTALTSPGRAPSPSSRLRGA